MKAKVKAEQLINKVHKLTLEFGRLQNYPLSQAIVLFLVEEILNISKQKGMHISNDAEEFYKEVKEEL